jgi:iron(III) transport system permease protein
VAVDIVNPELSPEQEKPKPARARSGFLDKRFFSIQVPLLLVTGALVLLPIGFIFYGALRTTTLTGLGETFTSGNLHMAYATWQELSTFFETALLSAVVAAIAVVVGSVFAWLLSRTNIPFRGPLEVAIMAPLFLSPFVGAVAWLILGSPRVGLINVLFNHLFPGVSHIINLTSLPGVIAVTSLYYIPYGYLYVSTSLRNMDPSLEEASYMSGTGVVATGWRITIKLMRPALISSFFFIFVLSAGLFSVAAVLGTGGSFQPLAVQIYQATSATPPNHGQAAALGSLLFWLTLCGIVLYRFGTRVARRFVTVTGKGFRARLITIGPWRWVTFAAGIVFVLLAVVLPYLVLFYVSLTPYVQTNPLAAKLSFHAFETLSSNLLVHQALENTVLVSVLTPTITVILGLLLAFSINRLRLRGGTLLDYIATLPIAVPGIVLATGLVWMYIGTPLYDTIWLLVAAFVVEYLPQALRISSNGMLQIDKSLEEASTMCGSSTLQTVRRVTVPLMKPALLSGWVLIFIFATREIGSAIILYGPNSAVLSVLTWDYLNYGDLQSAAVIGLFQTGLMLVGILVARYVFRVRLNSNRGGP